MCRAYLAEAEGCATALRTQKLWLSSRLATNRVLILAILVSNRILCLELDMIFRRSYFFIIADKT